MSNSEDAGLWWQSVSNILWDSSFWLPFGLKWEDLKSTEDLTYPDYLDLKTYPFIFAFSLFLIRMLILEPYVVEPWAIALEIPKAQRRHPPTKSPELEAMYSQYKKTVPRGILQQTAHSLGMTERQVERWIRQRGRASSSTNLDHFYIYAFISIFHTFYSIMSIFVLYPKPWVWNTELCWIDYPHHHLSTDVWWYYMIGFGFWWHMFFYHLVHHDSKLAIFHHLCTISLMSIAWACMYHRIGIMVLACHEFADVPVYIAKMYRMAPNKLKYEKTITILFVSFIVIWVVLRFIVYPFYIVYSAFFIATKTMWMPGAYIFYSLLGSLQLIHIVFSYFIGKVVYRKLTSGGNLKEESDGSSGEIKQNGTNKKAD